MSLGIRVWFLIKADEVEREGVHATVLATSHPHLQVPVTSLPPLRPDANCPETLLNENTFATSSGSPACQVRNRGLNIPSFTLFALLSWQKCPAPHYLANTYLLFKTHIELAFNALLLPLQGMLDQGAV